MTSPRIDEDLRAIWRALVPGSPSGAREPRDGPHRVQNVLWKLDVHNRLQAAAYAARHGLL